MATRHELATQLVTLTDIVRESGRTGDTINPVHKAELMRLTKELKKTR